MWQLLKVCQTQLKEKKWHKTHSSHPSSRRYKAFISPPTRLGRRKNKQKGRIRAKSNKGQTKMTKPTRLGKKKHLMPQFFSCLHNLFIFLFMYSRVMWFRDLWEQSKRMLIKKTTTNKIIKLKLKVDKVKTQQRCVCMFLSIYIIASHFPYGF